MLPEGRARAGRPGWGARASRSQGARRAGGASRPPTRWWSRASGRRWGRARGPRRWCGRRRLREWRHAPGRRDPGPQRGDPRGARAPGGRGALARDGLRTLLLAGWARELGLEATGQERDRSRRGLVEGAGSPEQGGAGGVPGAQRARRRRGGRALGDAGAGEEGAGARGADEISDGPSWGRGAGVPGARERAGRARCLEAAVKRGFGPRTPGIGGKPRPRGRAEPHGRSGLASGSLQERPAHT
jgi:hypothetical protein